MTNVINPNAAGIDISAKEHYVAVPEDRCKESIRCFPSFTEDLHKMAAWLKECHIETIAMESTGVYWYHLYTILLDYGFEVFLVNAHHVKHVPGRKSDVSDARWLQQLHSFGLLRSCYQPGNLTRALRNYVRQRKSIVQDMGRQTQRMQKALEQMNIKLTHVISDINGKTGRAIIDAILSGERRAEILAQLRDYRLKTPKAVLLKSLEGNWREEQLFNLRQAQEYCQFLEKQLFQCDQQSERILAQMDQRYSMKKNLSTERAERNQPKFNVRKYLYQSLGVDVTAIYGLKNTNALVVFSETGPNLKNKFPTEKQFLSWLNVVPDNKTSGGKIISSKVKKKKNHAGLAFRDAANALWNAQNPIGDYLRRKKARDGAKKAIVATARKLASIYYTMVTTNVEFDPQKIFMATQGYLQKRLIYLEKLTEKVKNQISDNQEFDLAVI